MHLLSKEHPRPLSTWDREHVDGYGFSIQGHTSRCQALIAQREHLLVGTSPFNSRFSPGYVSALLAWAHSQFSQVDVLLPDEEHATRLLVATGVLPGKATRKTRKELTRHRRSIRQALDSIGTRADAARIFDFSDFSAHPGYLRLHTQVNEAFDRCEKFREACETMSRQAVHGRVHGVSANATTGDDDHLRLAVPYIFAEMPFYLSSAELIGVPSSILAYHRPWPIGTGLFAGKFPLLVNAAQGHGIVSLTVSVASPADISSA
ncbi:MAG: tRNA-dependent cyclodipeptide synthase [Alcaligenaceae bacterium]|nr:MAG: tRNA-dependent cyclodipeptide synthase [Alcaligenaceae bacterium]